MFLKEVSSAHQSCINLTNKYSKISNIVKCYYNLKQVFLILENIFKYKLLCWNIDAESRQFKKQVLLDIEHIFTVNFDQFIVLAK